MNYYKIPPSVLLEPYVRFFWVLEGNSDKVPFVYRSMADNCPEILFHYKGVFNELQSDTVTAPLSLIHAQSSQHRRFETTVEFGIFGMYLCPFAIPIFLNIPSSELSNEMPSLQSLLGQTGSELEDRMMTAKDNTARVNIITAFFEGLLYKKSCNIELNIQQAILHMIHSHEQTSVKHLAGKFCLSERQFERKFKEYAGFGPKMYLRISRFHHAIQEYSYGSKTLSEIAQFCGYYDQSHFIHDFKEFSGYHPTHYFSPNRIDQSIIA